MKTFPTRRRTPRIIVGVAVLALLFAAAACGSDNKSQSSDGLTKVTMIQDWPTPWVGWIPWIVADEKGYFADEGIDINIQAPATVSDPVKFISTGRADVAFTTSLDVALAKDQDAPVTSIGAVTQTNNWGLIFEGAAPTDLSELAGKKIAIYQDAWTKAQLGAMLESAGLSLSDTVLVTAPNDTAPLLMAGKADVATGITNAEMTEVQIDGKQPPSIVLAKDHGVPNVYVQVLAAGDSWLKDNPDLADGFMRAVEKGTQFSIDNPDEALKIFQDRYPKALSTEYADASWKNTLPLYSSTDTQAHGLYWADEQRWQELIDFAAGAGLIESQLTAADLYTNDYLGKG